MKTENCCTGCNRPDLPWAGRGTELPIAGCRFTLYPMSDKYIEIILGALKKTDTSAVWSETDALSTVYRGKLPYVADAVQALFLNAYRPGVHMMRKRRSQPARPKNHPSLPKFPGRPSLQRSPFPVCGRGSHGR